MGHRKGERETPTSRGIKTGEGLGGGGGALREWRGEGTKESRGDWGKVARLEVKEGEGKSSENDKERMCKKR